ncbi:uncharacterized protein LOC113508907 [Trichoplusia ni]|uniref:Uncharacterized protein LOC113508907 n=1 Tax=Trichoplusia ni TaxID=7111 RepID=A0A7E5X3V0_TRINI|nr:uncharacterized protein LOC113508907 [Trichoplusia ni]
MQEEDEDASEISMTRMKADLPQKRRRAKKIKIPRRAPSVVIPERKIVYITADKTTCALCPCFPKEDPYAKPKKLKPCQKSPLTLYEIAASVVDQFPYPDHFSWTEEQVADWMADVVGLPQYQACILDNHINGRRLLRLEDPSVLPELNIHDWQHIKRITNEIRKIFTTDFIRFARSVGLPLRKPLTHCTWFKSQTGPTWGIRQNWERGDILRWMKIIMPEPLYLDHWDLVWYEKPDFPRLLLARIPQPEHREIIPQYKIVEDYCNEYVVPRKFRLQANIPDEMQMIWMEHRPGSPSHKPAKVKTVKIKKPKTPQENRLLPKKISLKGLAGKDLILARRQMPKPKFMKK